MKAKLWILSSVFAALTVAGTGASAQEIIPKALTQQTVQPPYLNDFSSETALEGYTILDENKDGKKWEVYNGQARMKWNSSLDMDDWMITPGILLEQGKTYEVSFQAKSAQSTPSERLEVKYGKSPTVEGMTVTLMPVTDLPKTYQSYKYSVKPDETGLYYIGFHGCSPASGFTLWVDDIAVSKGVATASPGVVTDLTAAGDPDGELKITISFKAPVQDSAGEELADAFDIEITRDGAEGAIKTFTAVTAGRELAHTDILPAAGLYTYHVTAVNANGKGQPADVSAFAGIDIPARPENVSISETANNGEVTLTWDAITKDHNGQAINPAKVKYAIYATEGNDRRLVKDNIDGTSYTFQAVAEGKQKFVQYAVCGVTESGEGDAAVSILIPAGTPYTGMHESFSDGIASHSFGIDPTNGGEFMVVSDLDGVTASDGDNGFLVMYGYYGYADLFFGKISLEGISNPALTFYRYAFDPWDDSSVEVFVKEIGDSEYESVYYKVSNKVAPDGGWGKTMVRLDDFAGKTIQVLFRPITSYPHKYVLIDNIRLGSVENHDLAAWDISAPVKVKAGDSYTVDVTVRNDGRLHVADGARVDLYTDGVLAGSHDLPAMDFDSNSTITFDCTTSVLSEEPIEHYAVVVYPDDDADGNNTSEIITVAPAVSVRPYVTDLSGSVTESGVALLSWSEPDLTGARTDPATVDFEQADAFAKELEGWIFEDVDDMPVAGFTGVTIPGIVPGNDKASFFVFDSSAQGFSDSQFASHSGTKSLASIFRWDSGMVDDWAISPALDGSAQTVSFFAKSCHTRFHEHIEMYYSTGSTDPADFIKVTEAKSVPSLWTEYSFDVPAGALRFAIRSCATDAYMLLLDDFTFTAADAAANMTIAGYNIFRDGCKINAECVAGTSFTDSDADDGLHTYRVTVVYNDGESKGSNEVSVQTSAIADATAGISVSTAGGTIIVRGAAGRRVIVSGMDGRVLFAGDGQDSMSVAVPAGVYIVRAGSLTEKVIVGGM